MKKEKNTLEQMQKKEKFISKIIIAVSIIVGVLMTVLLTGLVKLFN
jgi:hypothetical protein